MNIGEHRILAESLRVYFAEFADLPVPPGAFSLDGLLDSGASMSLQITGGQTVTTYINGRRDEMMAFTILYRDTVVQDNEAKSAMIGTLNGIGSWLAEQGRPFLGPGFTVTRLEQVQLANIIDQTEQSITYQAGFALGYTTN